MIFGLVLSYYRSLSPSSLLEWYGWQAIQFDIQSRDHPWDARSFSIHASDNDRITYTKRRLSSLFISDAAAATNDTENGTFLPLLSLNTQLYQPRLYCAYSYGTSDTGELNGLFFNTFFVANPAKRDHYVSSGVDYNASTDAGNGTQKRTFDISIKHCDDDKAKSYHTKYCILNWAESMSYTFLLYFRRSQNTILYGTAW